MTGKNLFKVSSADYPAWFYSQWVNHHLRDFQQIAAAKATTMSHIQRYHLQNAKIIFPNAHFFAKMGKIGFMETLTSRFIQNGIQSRTLASVRDSLLPKLLLGKL